MQTENNNNSTTSENLTLIQIIDGAYCRVNKVIADVDIVDVNGNPLEKDGVKQAPHSRIELGSEELAGLVLPVQRVAEKVFGIK